MPLNYTTEAVMAIPAKHPPTVHFPQSDTRCDQPPSIRKAALRIPGRRFVDLNAVAAKDGDVNLHWVDGPAKNHYRYIVDGKRVRPMTQAELHRPVADWRVSEILRWRRKPRRRSQRPGTVAERQRQCARLKVTACWEIKDRRYAASPGLASRFVTVVRASGGTAYYMTLMSMRDWEGKLKAFHDAGGQTALLSHGKHSRQVKPPYIDAVWN